MNKLITFPLVPHLTKDRKYVISVSLLILLFVTSVVVIQKYLEYGGSPYYNIANSILVNLIMIVPFTICIALSIKFSLTINNYSFNHYILYSLVFTIIIFPLYILCTNTILFIFNYSSSPVNIIFISKYLTNILQKHLVLYLFVQFYNFKKFRKINNPVTIKVASGQSTRTLSVDAIDWIESYDHYVKIYTGQELFIRRDTMKGILSKLDDNFIRIHRKYIVNMNSIDHLKQEQGKVLITVDNHELKVSNSYLTRVENLFHFTNN